MKPKTVVLSGEIPKDRVGYPVWLSPQNELYVLDSYHTDIRSYRDDIKEVWDDSDGTDDYVQKLFRMGWLRVRCYSALTINGCNLRKPTQRGRIRQIIEHYREHHGIPESKGVCLASSNQGPYGARCEDDARYTVGQFLRR